MKPIFHYHDQSHKNTAKKAYFPSCCPHQSNQLSHKNQNLFKKQKRFITLSKNISTSRQIAEFEVPLVTPKKVKIKENESPPQVQFQSDKFSFLQQIRNFNPISQQKEVEPQQPTFTLDSSKDINSSGKSNENNLSSMLDSINNEMFSNLLVSSSIKQKIIVSASLRSISQVRSQLQLSQKSESKVTSHINTER